VLGHSDRRSVSIPTKVQAFSKEAFSKEDTAQGDVRIIVAACGARHMAVLTATGKLWVWGGGGSDWPCMGLGRGGLRTAGVRDRPATS
jgi:alpha-tubulin suppressor-like RCC1 family protein